MPSDFTVKEQLNGIASELTDFCNNCTHEMSTVKTAENLNLRLQMAMYSIECNNRKGSRFLAAMDLPPSASEVRSSIFRGRIVKETRDIAKESKERAAEELKMADGDSVTVACDGGGFLARMG